MLSAGAQTKMATPSVTRHAAPMRITPVTTQPITEEPVGDKSGNWARSANYWMPYDDYTYEFFYESAIGNIVVNNSEKTLYIQTPWMNFDANTWVRGTINGETMTLNLPQAVYDNEGTMLYLAKMVYKEIYNDSGEIDSVAFYVDETDPNITFTYRNDSIVQVGTDKLAMIDANGNWYGYCEDTWVFNKIKDNIVTDENLSMEPYVLRHVKSKRFKYIDIMGCESGNTLYLSHLNANLPNSVVKGDINGNTVTFKAGQYLGPDEEEGMQMYFTNAAYDSEEYMYFGGIDLEMTKDADSDTLRGDNSSYFCINPGTHMVGSSYRWAQPVIFKYSEPTDAMPDPTFTKVYAFDSEEGYGEFRFDIPLTSANGQYFAANKVYYNVYLNEDMLTMTNDVYEMLPTESMVDIPYNYDDDYDVLIATKYHEFYYYKEVQKIGLRAFYLSNGTMNISNIVWYDLETGETTISSGINDVVAETAGNVARVEYYDLTGKRITEPSKGLYLKRVVMDNGTTHTSKLIK